MAFNYSPKVITDGLVLYLDAANSRSYPGTGTAWNDLSRGGNNGTLVNGPTFNSGNGGSIVLDGTDDFVNCGNNSNLQIIQGTISSWVRTTTPGASFRGIIVKRLNVGLFTNDGVLVTYDWGNGQSRSTGINIADGKWKNVAMSFTDNTGSPSNNAIIYLNGSAVLTTTVKYNSNNEEVLLGSGASFISTQCLNGNISTGLVYNRALSSTEILQNYNATKTRFGL